MNWKDDQIEKLILFYSHNSLVPEILQVPETGSLAGPKGLRKVELTFRFYRAAWKKKNLSRFLYYTKDHSLFFSEKKNGW